MCDKMGGRIITIPYAPRDVQFEIHELMESVRFTVIVAHRRLGKTVSMVNHQIRAAIKDNSGDGRFGYIAPFRSQAKSIAWDYFKHFSAPIPGRYVNESELYIQFINGSRIKLYGADNPDSLRGLYFDGVVMDEIADMKPEVWGEVVRPTLSDRRGWACFIGTPKGKNLFWDLYQGANSWKDWAARIYRANETGIISEMELEAARQAMSENQFRQEFLCDFSASTPNAIITIDSVMAATKRKVRDEDIVGEPRILGVDVARYGDDRSSICRRQGRKCLSIRPISHLDNMTFAGMVAEEIDAFQPHEVYIDAGRGEGVIDRLLQLGYEVIEVNFGSRSEFPEKYANKRSEIWDKMRKWIDEDDTELPNNSDLTTDLVTPTYTFDSSGRKQLESKEKMKSRGCKSPDLADSLALTFSDMCETMNTWSKLGREK